MNVQWKGSRKCPLLEQKRQGDPSYCRYHRRGIEWKSSVAVGLSTGPLPWRGSTSRDVAVWRGLYAVAVAVGVTSSVQLQSLLQWV